MDVHLFNGPTLAEQTNLRLIAVDRAILEDPEILLAMTTTIREGFRSGYAGGLEDARIYKSP